MNKNTAIHLKLYGLCCLIVFVILYAVCFVIYKFSPGTSLGKPILVSIPVSLILGFVLMKILLKREKTSPIGSKYSEMIQEVQKNGYSHRFYEIVDEGAALCAEKGDHDSNYYVGFMLYGAAAYCLKKEYGKALQYINSVDTTAIRSKGQEFLDHGETLALYFNTQMGICQGMGDVQRAENVLADAKNYVEKYYKAGGLNALSIDDMYCAYYAVKGDYENEFAHAVKIMEAKMPDAAKNPMAYLRFLEVYCKTGQRDNAKEMYKQLLLALTVPRNSNKDYLMKYADDLMAELNGCILQP